MHADLEMLLQIQDLKSQRRELTEAEEERELEREEFHVDVESAVAELDERIAAMEAELSPPIRSRYQRIAAGRGRPVVPVINGLCYGCFVAIPTAVASERSGHETLRHCDHCGRFIYILG